MMPSCKSLLIASVLALSAGATTARESHKIIGPVTHVRGGDTIEVSGIPVRLNGLHAPERNEPGGPEATAWMVSHPRGQTVTCSLTDERTHDRRVGTCANREGDLAQQLIAAGLGRDCRRFSGGRYARYERLEAVRFPLPAYCTPR
jgi:endonuclease YncB( thermonuclease family)